jgi:hypothetical protein
MEARNIHSGDTSDVRSKGERGFWGADLHVFALLKFLESALNHSFPFVSTGEVFIYHNVMPSSFYSPIPLIMT